MMKLERDCATAGHWTEQNYLRIFDGSTTRLCLVVEGAAAVLGFIVVSSVGDEWEVENIAVGQEARRRGVGSRLVSEFMERARARGAASVFLEVRESNGPARTLYEKYAFVEAGRRKGYYSGPVEDAVLYRRELTGDGDRAIG